MESISSQKLKLQFKEILKSYEGKDPATDHFQDSDFKAEIDSICPDKTHRNYDKIFSKAKWLRAKEILEISDGENLFEKLDPKNLAQGILGVSPFIGTIAALSESRERVEKLFNTKEANLYGVYSVNVFVNSIPTEIIVDDYFSCYEWGKPLFSKSRENELWILILEKAWAKICGSYTNAGFGRVQEILENLTGAPSVSLRLDEISEEQLWKRANFWNKKSYIMAGVMGNVVSKALGMTPAHTYPLIGTIDAGTHKVFKFRNPWGVLAWSGDFSNEWEGWTQELQSKIGYDKNEGDVFYMTVADFKKYFVTLDCCYYLDQFQRQHINLKQEGNKGSYFEFEVEEASDVFIWVTQQSKQLQKEDYKYSPVDLFLMQDVESNALVKIATGEKLSMKGAHTIFIDDRYGLKVEPGKYILKVKANWRSDEVSEFTLVTYTEKPIKLKPIKGKKKEIKEKLFRGLGLGNSEMKDIGEECTLAHGWEKRFLYFCVENNGENTCTVKITFSALRGAKIPKAFKKSDKEIVINVEPGSSECAYVTKKPIDGKPDIKWTVTVTPK